MARIGFESLKLKLGDDIYEYLWDGSIPNDTFYCTGECYCGKKHIRYEYTITHKQTGEEHIVGSTCWLHFLVYTGKMTEEEARKKMNRVEGLARKDRAYDIIMEKAITVSKYVRENEVDYMDYYLNNDRKMRVRKARILCEDLYKRAKDVYELMQFMDVDITHPYERKGIEQMTDEQFDAFKIVLSKKQLDECLTIRNPRFSFRNLVGIPKGY